jgi:Pvc16 N-terminal domain
VSNYLAVATVTATLQRILQVAVQQDVDGMRVTTLQPGQIGNGTPETGINLFLYQVSRNPALTNADMPTARSKGNPAKRQAALDLYYMISLYGNETELEPQRLLGGVVRTFSDLPILLPEVIRETIADSRFRFLAESTLADQIQQVMIHPEDLSLDDLSKVWSTFFQAPYRLSITYKVTMVTIEGEESAKKGLPVRDHSFGGITSFPNQPVIEQVASDRGKMEPILATTTLQIIGNQLQNPRTQVRLGGFEATPSSVSDTQIILPLTAFPVDALRAGVQGLQVIHRLHTGTTALSARSCAVESNAFPIVLRPTIKRVHLTTSSGHGDDLRSALLTVQVDVRVGMKQRVMLVMNEWSIAEPVGYQFEVPTRTADTHALAIPLQGVKPGEYLLRLQIDGAESLLSIDSDPNSPTFNWYSSPKIQIE